MTPREIVLAQIEHSPANPVPYIVGCCDLDRTRKEEEPIDAVRVRDLFGSIWRLDRRPYHLEQPGLPTPSLLYSRQSPTAATLT